MTKKYVDVIGITRGKAPEVLATFSEKKDANWHIKNTFIQEERCLTKTTKVKGDKFVKDEIAEDRDVYLKSEVEMRVEDLEKVKVMTESNTLLHYFLTGEVTKKTDLEKLNMLESEEGQKRLELIYNEETAFPYSKVKKRLSDALIDELVGAEEVEEDEEVAEVEAEEEVEEETEEEVEEEAEVEEIEEEPEVEEVEEAEVEEIEEETEEEVEEEEVEEVEETEEEIVDLDEDLDDYEELDEDEVEFTDEDLEDLEDLE